MLLLLTWLAVGGLIIGGLGRLLVPGPNPIGLIRTAITDVRRRDDRAAAWI